MGADACGLLQGFRRVSAELMDQTPKEYPKQRPNPVAPDTGQGLRTNWPRAVGSRVLELVCLVYGPELRRKWRAAGANITPT